MADFAGDAEALEEIRAGDVRRLALRLADAEIDRRLAEIDRHELAVNVGDMQQRDIAERIELEEFVLRQLLLREGAREAAAAGHQGRGRGADLKNFTAGDHLVSPLLDKK